MRVKVLTTCSVNRTLRSSARATLASRLRRFLPSLTDAPLLMPTANAALRRTLDEWFDEDNLRARLTGEFEDGALMNVFGQATGVVFPAPAAIAADVCRLYSVREIGRTAAVRERYYAITAERRLKHPGVLAITNAARDEVFAAPR